MSDNYLTIKKQGKPKFMEKVCEISFNAKCAIAKGTKVYYVNTVGIFQLTEAGLELIRVMPGVDIEKDIINFSGAKIHVPAGGVPQVGNDLVTGAGFFLKFEHAQDAAKMAARAKEREKEFFAQK